MTKTGKKEFWVCEGCNFCENTYCIWHNPLDISHIFLPHTTKKYCSLALGNHLLSIDLVNINTKIHRTETKFIKYKKMQSEKEYAERDHDYEKKYLSPNQYARLRVPRLNPRLDSEVYTTNTPSTSAYRYV